MTSRTFLNLFRHSIAVLAVGMIAPSAFAQGPAAPAIPEAPSVTTESIAPAIVSTPSLIAGPAAPGEHRFWDRENVALFAASAALSGADFAVTRSNLQSGGQELNPVVRLFGRSSAGLALNFAGETAGVVSLSYLLHRTGHHKLERAVSMANLGASAGAVSFGIASR